MAKQRDMRRSYDDDEDELVEEPSWAIPLVVLGVVLVLSLGFLAYYFRPTLGQLMGRAPAPSIENHPLDIIIAGQRHLIPESFTRFAYTRRGGIQDKIELYALLPDLSPYDPSRADEFQDYGIDSNIVFIDIDSAKEKMSETERFNRVYLKLVTDPEGRRGPAGLRRYDFDTTSSYKNEELFIRSRDDGEVVVLRCMKEAPDIVSPNCRRDMSLGDGLTLHYRFKRAHLGSWEDIDAGVRALVKSFQVAPKPAP